MAGCIAVTLLLSSSNPWTFFESTTTCCRCLVTLSWIYRDSLRVPLLDQFLHTFMRLQDYYDLDDHMREKVPSVFVDESSSSFPISLVTHISAGIQCGVNSQGERHEP